MRNAIDLAKYIVKKCIDENMPISNLQLQKILYYIQRDFLKRDELAFVDNIEAWQFGPVVPNVYYHYCGYGAMPISVSCELNNSLDYDCSLINPIIEEKRALNPWELVEDTHRRDGAWDKIYANGSGNHQVIPTDLIKAVG